MTLPIPVAIFFRALAAREPPALLASFRAEALVKDAGAEYHGRDAILDWVERLMRVPAGACRPLKSATDRLKVDVLTPLRADSIGAIGHTRWSFLISAQEIVALTLVEELGPELPGPSATFVRAVNSGQLDVLLDAFAEDAMVNDQLHEYWYRREISQWAERDVIGQHLYFHVERVRINHEQTVVMVIADGDFDKRGLPEPLLVTLYFSVREGKIGQLLILPSEDH